MDESYNKLILLLSFSLYGIVIYLKYLLEKSTQKSVNDPMCSIFVVRSPMQCTVGTYLSKSQEEELFRRIVKSGQRSAARVSVPASIASISAQRSSQSAVVSYVLALSVEAVNLEIDVEQIQESLDNTNLLF